MEFSLSLATDSDLDTTGPKLIRLGPVLAAVAVALLCALAIDLAELAPSYPLTRHLLRSQDLPVLLPVAALLLVLAMLPMPAAFGRWTERLVVLASRWGWIAAVGFAAAVVGLGTRYVTSDTPVSHDEIMATFDAAIVASGRLMAPIAPEWRSLSWALEPVFRLPVPGDVAWVSTYLPGNALIRGVLGIYLDTALVNALLVAVALLALAAIARQLWPGQGGLHLVVVLLAALSSQVLCMGMTPYAMTAHLALNLIWLWLFLRNSWASHTLAIATGFLATGLHQIVFHPLFAAPFILQLLLQRRWRIAALAHALRPAPGAVWPSDHAAVVADLAHA